MIKVNGDIVRKKQLEDQYQEIFKMAKPYILTKTFEEISQKKQNRSNEPVHLQTWTTYGACEEPRQL